MVTVPSGDDAVIVPVCPGRMLASSRKSSRPGVNSSSSGMRFTVNRCPTLSVAEPVRGLAPAPIATCRATF